MLHTDTIVMVLNQSSKQHNSIKTTFNGQGNLPKLVQEDIMFKDIKGFEGLYAIYNDGRVYSYKTGKFLKPYKHKGGYLIVSLQT